MSEPTYQWSRIKNDAPNQSGFIDGVQFDKSDPTTRLFIAANYWRERCFLYKTELVTARSQIADLKRSEYICRKCGLRNDGGHEQGDF